MHPLILYLLPVLTSVSVVAILLVLWQRRALAAQQQTIATLEETCRDLRTRLAVVPAPIAKQARRDSVPVPLGLPAVGLPGLARSEVRLRRHRLFDPTCEEGASPRSSVPWHSEPGAPEITRPGWVNIDLGDLEVPVPTHAVDADSTRRNRPHALEVPAHAA